MARRESDSFMASGAMPSPPHFMSPASSISPTTIPRSIPANMDSYISPHTISAHSPRNSSLSPTRQATGYFPQHSHDSPSQVPPISPPKTRSTSADDPDRLVDDWRKYTAKLREQFAGERAHMIADRKRADEVIAEERSLWDEERNILKARISQLERKTSQLEQSLDSRGRLGGSLRGSRDTSMNRIPPGMTQRHSIQQQSIFMSPPNAVSISSSDGIPARGTVPQERGRGSDGLPFYAPAARNPSRTFSTSSLPSDTLRVDDITAPRESAIRVTSKELTPSDFGPQSPPTHPPHRESALDTIPETMPEKAAIPETIDISLIQPELEGVAIKTSAVSPTFVAKVMSPQFSPAKLSPNTFPPGRDVENLSRGGSVRGRDSNENGRGKLDVKAVMEHPVERRLTIHAGHTPNHSITKFDLMGSGIATPTQEMSDSHTATYTDHNIRQESIHRPTIALFDGAREEKGYGNLEDEDRELTGQLGLTHDEEKNAAFLAQLTQKLEEEARKSEGGSPNDLLPSLEDLDKNKEDDMPKLRLKPSTNFGRPLGSM